MNDKPSSTPAPLTWATVRRVLLVSVPVFWCFGFLFSHYVCKCSAEQAFLKATAFALSGLAGCGVFLLFWIRSSPEAIPVFAMLTLFSVSLSFLEERVQPWPFRSMLAHGVIGSCITALLVGFLFRFLLDRGKLRMGPGKSTRPSRFPFLRGGSQGR